MGELCWTRCCGSMCERSAPRDLSTVVTLPGGVPGGGAFLGGAPGGASFIGGAAFLGDAPVRGAFICGGGRSHTPDSRMRWRPTRALAVCCPFSSSVAGKLLIGSP